MLFLGIFKFSQRILKDEIKGFKTGWPNFSKFWPQRGQNWGQRSNLKFFCFSFIWPKISVFLTEKWILGWNRPIFRKISLKSTEYRIDPIFCFRALFFTFLAISQLLIGIFEKKYIFENYMKHQVEYKLSSLLYVIRKLIKIISK